MREKGGKLHSHPVHLSESHFRFSSPKGISGFLRPQMADLMGLPQLSLSTSGLDFCSPESQLAADGVSSGAHRQLLLPLMTFLEGEDLIESTDIDPRGYIFSVLLGELGMQLLLLMKTGDLYIQFLAHRAANVPHNLRELCLKGYAVVEKSLMMKQCLSGGKILVLILNEFLQQRLSSKYYRMKISHFRIPNLK